MSEGSIRLVGAAQSGRDAVGDSGDDGGTLPRFWLEKQGEAEPEDPSRNPSTQPYEKSSAIPVLVAHAEFVAALAGHPPRTIPLDADTIDLEAAPIT